MFPKTRRAQWECPPQSIKRVQTRRRLLVPITWSVGYLSICGYRVSTSGNNRNRYYHCPLNLLAHAAMRRRPREGMYFREQSINTTDVMAFCTPLLLIIHHSYIPWDMLGSLVIVRSSHCTPRRLGCASRQGVQVNVWCQYPGIPATSPLSRPRRVLQRIKREFLKVTSGSRVTLTYSPYAYMVVRLKDPSVARSTCYFDRT